MASRLRGRARGAQQGREGQGAEGFRVVRAAEHNEGGGWGREAGTA